jgi:antitoxin CcdA
MKTVYSLDAPKRAFNLSLNEDLVAQARRYSSNLSAEVEALLATYVQQQKQLREDKMAQARHTCAAWNAFHRQHGSLSDEFSPL